MKKNKSFTIIGLIFLSLSSIAQEIWTLEKCINYAYENNIRIKQQELNAKYSKNTLIQSKAGALPSLNANASHNYNFGRSVDPYTYDFTENNIQSNNFSLSSSVILFNGLQTYNTIKQNQLNLLADLQDVEKAKNDISLNIASAFLQILFNEELLNVAKSQLEITQQQVERTKNLVDAGSLAKGSLLEIEAQTALENLKVVNAQNQLNISYLTLTQLLDLDSVGGFKIEHPQFPDLEEKNLIPSVNQVYLEAINNLPQIKSAEYKLSGSEKGLNIARGTRSPRLSLSASYGTGYSNAIENFIITDTTYGSVLSGYTLSGEDVYTNTYDIDYETETRPFGDQFRDNASTSLSFNLTIPIFNGLQVHSSISNAKISVLNSKYQLELAKNQLYKEIQQAHADAMAALNKFFATKKAVSSMAESFQYTQQKFNVGLVTSVDYNIAKNNLTKAKSDLLQAKYEYIFKSKVLDFYRGKPIEL